MGTNSLTEESAKSRVACGKAFAWHDESSGLVIDHESGRIFRSDHFDRPKVPTDDVAINISNAQVSLFPNPGSWSKQNKSFVPLYLHAGNLMVGPVVGGDSSCAVCLAVRLLSSHVRGDVLAGAWSLRPPTNSWMTTLIEGSSAPEQVEAMMFEADRGTVAAYSLISETWSLHYIHPLPGCPEHDLSDQGKSVIGS